MTIPQINYDERLELDYRHFDANAIEPRFEFGFGLSYTMFKYSSLRLAKLGKHHSHSSGKDGHDSPARRQPGGDTYLYHDLLSVSVDVGNTGPRDGHEVVQMYLGFPEGAGEPPKVLRGAHRLFGPQRLTRG